MAYPFIQANSKNYKVGRSKPIKYIVIHYTGNNGDTAKGNCLYFRNNKVKVSAHYFVDKTSIYQSIKESDTAYAVGALRYKHKYCRNNNSISIELCSRKDTSGNYYFESGTVKNAIKLTKELMSKYNIPIENVIRHYDVTGKICPRPYVYNVGDWNEFKNKLIEIDVPFKVMVTADTLNLREGIGTSYKIISVLKKGDMFTISQVKNGWGKPKWYYDNKKEGWLNLSYVKKL